MKSIRSLFILIIGMMVLTVTAKTTAKLKQKQNVELAMGLIPQVATLQVVKTFPAIQSEIAVAKSLEIQKPFYEASIDVGIYKQENIFNTIYTTFSKNLDKNYQGQIKCSRYSLVYSSQDKKKKKVPRFC